MATTVGNFDPSEGWERFNKEAASWDSNPLVHISGRHAADAILRNLLEWSNEPNNPGQKYNSTVLEIGCGTGILTLNVAPSVERVVAVDAAQAMIKVLESKLTKPESSTNITPVCTLLIDPESKEMPPTNPQDSDGPRLKYDLIISHLVMHHIPDLRPLLETMLGCLKPGGRVCLTDFEDFGPEARKFHPKSKLKGVYRDGIHPTTMENLMKEVGFCEIKIERSWTMQKEVEKYEGQFGANGRGTPGNEGVMMDFHFLTCCGQWK